MTNVEHKIESYMTKKIITFYPDTSIYKAIQSLLDHRVSGAPVIDHSGAIVGVLSEKDCINTILKSSYFEGPDDSVGEYMHKHVKTVYTTDSVADVAAQFAHLNYRRFPVINDEGKLVGVISRRDIIRAILDINDERSKK